MAIEITYKDIQTETGLPYPALSLFANQLWEQDPDSPRGGGRARRFGLDEGFLETLGAILVADFRIKPSQAKVHVIAISLEMGRLGLLPSQVWANPVPVPRFMVLIHNVKGKGEFAYGWRRYDWPEPHEEDKTESTGAGLKQITRVNDGPYETWTVPEIYSGQESLVPVPVPVSAILSTYGKIVWTAATRK